MNVSVDVINEDGTITVSMLQSGNVMVDIQAQGTGTHILLSKAEAVEFFLSAIQIIEKYG